MNRIALALLLLAVGPLPGAAQDAKKVVVDEFEGDLDGWAAFKVDNGAFGQDTDSTLAVTHESTEVKTGKGTLSYGYEVGGKTVRLLGLQRPLDLSGMKSFTAWVKCSATTALVFSLTETGGAGYQAAVYCTGGAWQRIAINLDEFALDDPAKDANGKLDLDQIGSMQVLDMSGFLATFLPDLKGKRTIWLDDVVFSSQPAPVTTGLTQVTKTVPVYVVDNFESGTIRWASVSLEFADTPKFNIFDAPLAIDSIAPPKGGKQSLKFTYPRKGRKFHGIMRSLEKVDLSKALSLELSLKAFHDGTFVIAIEEKDGSRYQKTVEIKGLDGWKSFHFALSEFTLAEDSKDENGRLDADQIKQLSIADISALSGGTEVEETRLWIDEVRLNLKD